MFAGSVENVQIHPRSQNFDINKRSKASLPVIGSFKRSLHDFKSQQDESVPVRLSNKTVSGQVHKLQKLIKFKPRCERFQVPLLFC